MGDKEILDQIRRLVDEEHALRDAAEVDDQHLGELEETLDQSWDLLRQRRARREFGQDKATTKVRDVDTVEHYKQ